MYYFQIIMPYFICFRKFMDNDILIETKLIWIEFYNVLTSFTLILINRIWISQIVRLASGIVTHIRILEMIAAINLNLIYLTIIFYVATVT